MLQIFFIPNRTDEAWTTLDEALANFNYEVAQVPMDGYCFLSALKECLFREHRLPLTLDTIKEVLDLEIWENCDAYKKSYVGTKKQMCFALHDYLYQGKWATSIVDICVCAAAKCFNVNM